MLAYDIESWGNHDFQADQVWFFGFYDLTRNDFVVWNQFTIIENNINKQPDVVLFINGIPFSFIEFKNPSDENSTVKKVFVQI